MAKQVNKFRYTPLQIVMHLGGWLPLARLLFDAASGHLGPNPIQDIEQRTGRAAVTSLILSLACTPFNTLFGWRELLRRRRALGLYAFLYACLHVLLFIDLDYGLNWRLILKAVLEKRFILVGATALLLLLLLAITSFDVWVTRLRKNWKHLHRLVYCADCHLAVYMGAQRRHLSFTRRCSSTAALRSCGWDVTCFPPSLPAQDNRLFSDP
ncbi:MAG: sulfite oxidase heme-binding subunit YedZ [Candidatus Villigracilaceae bacterium]